MRTVPMSTSIWLLCFLVGSVVAQYQFSNPDPYLDDLEENWTVGETINISWEPGWNGTGTALERADLWVTWSRSGDFSKLLLEDVQLAIEGDVDWKVDISDDIIKKDAQFIFRFIPRSDPPVYTWSETQSLSRAFLLYPRDPSASPLTSATLSSATATSTPTGSSTNESSQSTADPSPAANENQSDSKPNTGAIVGGVIGGVLFLALLILGLLFLRRKRRERYGQVENSSQKFHFWHKGQAPRSQQPVELNAESIKYEMEDTDARVHETPTGTEQYERWKWEQNNHNPHLNQWNGH